MTTLSSFPITQKWPAQHPERLQLYSLPTPNGVKVSILLEEIGLPYEVHLVNFATHDQLSPAFLSLNPNHKIPAILDPNGPGGEPLALFESGAILLYLAEKTGQCIPRDAALRYEPSDRSIRAVQPHFQNLQFPSLQPAVVELLNSYGPALAQQSLQELVLHQLRPQDLALPDTMGLQPGRITVTDKGLVIGFVNQPTAPVSKP